MSFLLPVLRLEPALSPTRDDPRVQRMSESVCVRGIVASTSTSLSENPGGSLCCALEKE